MKEELLNYTDLASEKIGGQVVFATDEFFAEKENLIKPEPAIFIEGKYTENGKWMDGWESRRKRTQGHDYAIVSLGAEGKIKGFNIDTSYFLGNHPPHASVDALYFDGEVEDWELANYLQWDEILEKSPLEPGSEHFFEITSDKIYNHVRLHIYPDGGVARFRVYGEVHKDWEKVKEHQQIDLVLANHCGKALACNDMFFSNMENLLNPNKGKNMGDGWETKRNRIPNNEDWVIIKLGHKGFVEKIIVDTYHFKGNHPESCAIDYCISDNDDNVLNDTVKWRELLPKKGLKPHRENPFSGKDVREHEAITHVKLKIYPDGGVSRLRLLGTIKK